MLFMGHTPAKSIGYIGIKKEQPLNEVIYSSRVGGYYIGEHSALTQLYIYLGKYEEKKITPHPNYPDLRRRLSYWIWQKNKNINDGKYLGDSSGINKNNIKDFPIITPEILEEAMQWEAPSLDTRIKIF